MSVKVKMKSLIFKLLKMKLFTLINSGKSWSKMNDDEKKKILETINQELKTSFTIEEIDVIWEDINSCRYEHIEIEDGIVDGR